MAEVSRNLNTIVTGYTLKVSPEEAKLLRDVLRRIAGDPKSTRRGLANGIEVSLAEAGADHTSIFEDSDLSGGIEAKAT